MYQIILLVWLWKRVIGTRRRTARVVPYTHIKCTSMAYYTDLHFAWLRLFPLIDRQRILNDAETLRNQRNLVLPYHGLPYYRHTIQFKYRRPYNTTLNVKTEFFIPAFPFLSPTTISALCVGRLPPRVILTTRFVYRMTLVRNGMHS